mgnify:FL=1|jgi:hypothetical protein
MKKKIGKVLIFFIILLLISNSLVVYAAKRDYDLGYDTGEELARENKGKGVSAESAWRKHYSSDDYPIDLIEDESSYRSGFFDGYREHISEEKTELDFPFELGKALGSIYGYRDFQNGVKANWKKALPNERTLKRMFNLNMESREYVDEFLSQFTTFFEEWYKKSYEKAIIKPILTSLEQGVEDGEKLGALFGGTFGVKGYYENRDNDFTRNLPSDRDIISDYSLRSDNKEYMDGFLSGFKDAYEIEYNKVFREANINETVRDEGEAYIHGKEVGLIQGEIIATEDYLKYLNNDWKRSVPDNLQIIDDYNLSLQSSNYRDGFIAGFFDGYSEGYQAKFKNFSQESAINKRISALIPIKGGSLNSFDNAFGISITSGTYFNPVTVTIDTLYNNTKFNSTYFTKASESYNVSILNTSSNMDDNKLIEIIFEYYGDKVKGGIYRYVDNKWLYLPSVIEEGVIKTYIRPMSLKNDGIFSVFVDKNASVFPDTRGHWARDEINSYIRRGFIYGYGDKTFKPENNISKVEFLTILSRVYNWDSVEFKDYSNNPISYREVEKIMRNVENNYGFKWNDMAIKMLHERLVKSNSFINMDNKITRAEVVYMLYHLNDDKY